ncbi:hypothetical protein LCGC14_2872370 [marine sediment metagenome]|uniref:Uncharacterized protein n=1 Tax=marine sediment metagenome TaxID=412755 RepID=A0A0F8Y2F4_9ZZZZ
MLENTLAPIADQMCNDPDFKEKVTLDVELRTNFMNGGGCDHDYTESEVISKKHNLPVDPNQEKNYQDDLEMRFQQHKQKSLEPVEAKPELKSTLEVIDECISKLMSKN